MSLRSSVVQKFGLWLFIILSACVGTNHRATLDTNELTKTGSTESEPDSPSRLVNSTRELSFTTNEGTWMALDVSPDGETIVFDLLGDLFLIPSGGGDAVPLTTGRAWDQSPRFSPDGENVFFISDRVGHKNLWCLSLSDLSVRQVTDIDRHIAGAINWTSDRQHLLAGIGGLGLDFVRGGEVLLHSIDPNSGNITPLEPWAPPLFETSSGHTRTKRSPRQVFSGVAGSEESSFFFSEAAMEENADNSRQFRVRLYKFDVSTNTRIQLTHENSQYSEFKPQLSHSGALLAYYRQYDDRRTELRLLNLTTQEDRLVTTLDNAEDARYAIHDDQRPNYAFMPADAALVFWHAGKIRSISLADGSSKVVPFRAHIALDVALRALPAAPKISSVEPAKTVRRPSYSRDGGTMVFAAYAYLWIMDVESGDIRRLTGSDEYAFMPSISPDGTAVVYTSISSNWNEYRSWREDGKNIESGRLKLIDIESRQSKELLSEPQTRFLLPSWSDDGTKIATLRRARTDNPPQFTFGWTTKSGGEFKEVFPLPSGYTWPANMPLFSRWVGFDDTARNLIFSYPATPEKTLLAMADMKGNNFRILAIGASDVGGITPSPDFSALALTRRDGTLWSVPFYLGQEPRAISTFTPEASRISENGGYYPVWFGDGLLSYGFGSRVFRYDSNSEARSANEVKISLARPTPHRPVAYRGARLITLSEENHEGVIGRGVLIVEQGRITAVGPEGSVEIPEDASVIDVTGKTIVPGFIDTHYHGMGILNSYGLPLGGSWSDRSSIQYGVTSAWEPGGNFDDGGTAHEDVRMEGRVLGPRWSDASQPLSALYPMLTEDFDRALATVGRYKDLDVSVLKEYLVDTRLEQQWVAAAARHHGLGIVSHLNRFDMTMTRILDGYTGGDHPYLPVPFYRDVQELLTKTGFLWTPNIIITPSTTSAFGSGTALPTYFCDAVAAGFEQDSPVATKADDLCAKLIRNETLPSFEFHRAGRVARQATIALNNGASIGVSAHDRPSFNLHMEMWALWKGGMSAHDVLRATSMTNAEKLGLQDQIGSLEVGKIADFVVLNANPLDNILNTMSIENTVQFGRIYDSDSGELIDPESIAVTVH